MLSCSQLKRPSTSLSNLKTNEDLVIFLCFSSLPPLRPVGATDPRGQEARKVSEMKIATKYRISRKGYAVTLYYDDGSKGTVWFENFLKAFGNLSLIHI